MPREDSGMPPEPGAPPRGREPPFRCDFPPARRPSGGNKPDPRGCGEVPLTEFAEGPRDGTADPLPGRESPGHSAPKDPGQLVPRHNPFGFVQGGRGSRAGPDELRPGGFSNFPRGGRRRLCSPTNRSGTDDRLPTKGKDQAAPHRTGARGLSPRFAWELPFRSPPLRAESIPSRARQAQARRVFQLPAGQAASALLAEDP